MASENKTSGGFSQDFGGSEIHSGDGSSGGRGGDVGSYNTVKNSNNVNNTTINFYGPQFIVNSDGRSLDLSRSDKNTVISYPFHGGLNQQWLVQDDGDGGVALMSKFNKTYVALKNPSQDATLIAKDTPFYWNIVKDGGGYKLAVPGSDVGLSLGNAATLRPLSESQGSRLYILENTPENIAAIKSGKFVPPDPSTTENSPSKGSNAGGPNINVIINDTSGPGNAVKTLEHFQKFFASDGFKNLVICFGHHQIADSSAPTSTSSSSSNPPRDTPTNVATPTPTARPITSRSNSKKLVISQAAPVPTAIRGTADIVGFGTAGVEIMRNSIKPHKKLVLANFGYNAGGWRVEKHVRLLADTTGDGKADIVGFGESGVLVSLNNGDNTFPQPKLVLSDFAYSGGWRIEKHVRFMADIRNIGRADIVGFGEAGVLVSLNNGDGTFSRAQLALNDFGYGGGGWRVDKHLRFLADMNGNGFLDIVGFGEYHVLIAFGNGDGTFRPVQAAVSDFCYNNGWRIEKHVRFVADLTGDGRPDLVGFGEDGVYAAYNKGDGTFQPVRKILDDFCYNSTWRVEKHPRFIADLTGNGCGDIIGFGENGVYIAINNGDGTFQPSKLATKPFGYDGNWRVGEHPRLVADMTGDGRADLVGFGSSGVYASYNDGSGNFDQAITQIISGFGADDSEWGKDKSVKYVANLSI